MNQNSSQALSAFAQRLHPRIESLADDGFNELALELFGLQWSHNPALARLCGRRGPGSFAHWTELPAVPAVAFKELELTSIPAGERTREFQSSGTTGQRPSRHYHHAESLRLYEASLSVWHARHFGWGTGCPRMVFLTPPPSQAAHSSLVHMMDTLGRRAETASKQSSPKLLSEPLPATPKRREGGSEPLSKSQPDGPLSSTKVPTKARQFEFETASAPAPGFLFTGTAQGDGSWALETGRVVELLEAAARTGEPLALLGTAFNFAQLLETLTEQSLAFALPRRSRVMETGGYKGRTRALPKGELHEWISARLGIPDSHVVCEYGMSELSSQAYDHSIGGSPGAASQRVFRFPPWARAIIVSPETGRPVAAGEAGLIRVIDLANVWSAMVVQTEDLGIQRAGGFEFVGRAARAEARGCSLQSA